MNKYLHPTEVPRSKTFGAIEWEGERIKVNNHIIKGDTYPMTWADNDNIYTGVGDPLWCEIDGIAYNSHNENFKPYEKEYLYKIYGLSFERITGAAESFLVDRIDDMPGYIGWGGHGPKPCGVTSVNGIIYYAVQNLLGWKPPRHGINSQHGSDATIIKSDDYGKTWTPELNDTLRSFYTENFIENEDGLNDPDKMWKLSIEERHKINDWYPMFSGNLFGGPSFVQFGKDNSTAVNDYIYAVSADQWDNGSEIRLGRVKNDKILCRKEWEFAIPAKDGNVEWTNSLHRSSPIISIERHLSLPEMVYLPSVKKYILATWALYKDFNPNMGSELTILEADNPWGPFSLVHYEWMWFKQEMGCYCPRIPLKWFDEKNMSGYILHSGIWDQPGCFEYYMPQLRKFKLVPAYNK